MLPLRVEKAELSKSGGNTHYIAMFQVFHLSKIGKKPKMNPICPRSGKGYDIDCNRSEDPHMKNSTLINPCTRANLLCLTDSVNQ